MFAAEQRRETAEHRLIGHAVLVGELLADAVREVLVVGHVHTKRTVIEIDLRK